MATEGFDNENDQGLSGMDLVKGFNSDLNSMCETKPPVSKAKMISVTKSAMKAHRMYKHVVHCVEKFIQKCRPEYKVPGLYVMDSIIRQSRHQFPNEKEVFAPRFSKNIQATFKNLLKCRDVEIPKLVRVLNLWQKNGIYSPSVIQPLLGMVAPRPGIHSSLSRTTQKQDPSLNAAEVVAANAVAIIQQQQTHIQALLQQQAQQQIASLSPNLLQNIQSLQSLLSNANIVTPIAAPAVSTNPNISIPLSSTLEKLKEAASSVLGLTGSTASGTAHSSSMADLEPAQEFKPKLKPHQLQHINQFLEQQETSQNHEYINEVTQHIGLPPPPPPPPPPVPSDSQQRRMERNLREFEREHKILHKGPSVNPWSSKRGRHADNKVHQLERHEEISDDEGGVDMDVGTPSPPIFEDTTRSFLDDFDYGDDQGEDERIEEQKRRVTQERNRVDMLSARNAPRFPSPTSLSPPVTMSMKPPQPKQQSHRIHDDKVGDSIPTISRIQLGSSNRSPERSQPPYMQNVVPINPSPNQAIPPVRLPWMDGPLGPPPTAPMHSFPRPMLPGLPAGLPSRHLFPHPPFLPPQQHRPPFPLHPPRGPFHPPAEFPPPLMRPDNFSHHSEYPPKDTYHARERDEYPYGGPHSKSPLRENSDSPRGAFSRWHHTPSPPPEPRERDKKRRFRRDSKDVSFEYEERRRYRSRSRSPERDKDRERRRKRHNSHSPVDRREKNKRRDKSRSPREKRKRRESEIKDKERTRFGKESERMTLSYHSPPSKWKALDTIEPDSRTQEYEVERTTEVYKVNSKRENEREKKHSFSLAKLKCISVLSTTIWVQVKKVSPNIEKIIRDKCEEFGRVLCFDLIPSRGCAFFEMETRESAESLVNEEREINLGSVTSKLVYAPGKGVKGDSFKPHWDSTQGVTYLPWSILSDDEFDLAEFQEGGIIDPDTLPPGVQMPEKKVVLPPAPMFMTLPPMIPPFPPPMGPSPAAIIPPTQPTFPGPPPVGLLPLQIPDPQSAQPLPPLLHNQQVDQNTAPPMTSAGTSSYEKDPNEGHLSTQTTPPVEIHRTQPDLYPFPPTGLGLTPIQNVRFENGNEAERFPRPNFAFPPPPPPRPSLPPNPGFRFPPPHPEFRRPHFPQMSPPSMPHPHPHPHPPPDPRFRVPPPVRMRGPTPNEFKFPAPRDHRSPPVRHEFKVPAYPNEHRNNHFPDSTSNDRQPPTFARPSTPPGYDRGSPQRREPIHNYVPSPERDISIPPSPSSSQTPEDSGTEVTDQPLNRTNKSLVAEYSGIYSPHSDEESGSTSGSRALASSPHSTPQT